MTLRQWSRLVDAPYKTAQEQIVYPTLAEDLMLDAVSSRVEVDSVELPTPEKWAVLNLLQRFSRIKLVQSKHENENFVTALKKIGLLQGGC